MYNSLTYAYRSIYINMCILMSGSLVCTRSASPSIQRVPARHVRAVVPRPLDTAGDAAVARGKRVY